MRIEKIIGRQILDSRGQPTVEADIFLDNGKMGRASVPSGASTGRREACELRDNDKRKYHGKGVTQAVKHLNVDIHNYFKGFEACHQTQFDQKLCLLDGTENKSKLGANALLAASLAYARASAATKEIPLYQWLNQGQPYRMPVPMMNVLNGGAHADNNVDIQEFMIMPTGAKDFPQALQMGAEVFQVLKTVLKSKGLNTAVGDEGGFAPDLTSNQQALDILSESIEKAGYHLGKDMVLALDVAASELHHEGSYHLASENKQWKAEEMINYYEKLINTYPIVSIEDGLDESDWSGWHHLTETLGQRVQLVGDDIFVTHPNLLKKGIEQDIGNAILIKLNQIGTLSETLETIELAHKNNYKCVISHRSGETEDAFIADLAVATGAGQIKTGSLCRSDRIAKYNQLLRINELEIIPFPQKLFL